MKKTISVLLALSIISVGFSVYTPTRLPNGLEVSEFISPNESVYGGTGRLTINAQALNILETTTLAGSFAVDQISEKTSAHGVSIDGALIKDGGANMYFGGNGSIAAPNINFATNSGVYGYSGVAGLSTAGSWKAELNGSGVFAANGTVSADKMVVSTTITANKVYAPTLTDGTQTFAAGSQTGVVNINASGTITANKLAGDGSGITGIVTLTTNISGVNLSMSGTVTADTFAGITSIKTAGEFSSYNGTSNIGRALIDRQGNGGASRLLLYDANGSLVNLFGSDGSGYNNYLNSSGGSTAIGKDWSAAAIGAKLEVVGTISGSALQVNGTMTGEVRGVTMSMSAMPYLNAYVNGNSAIATGGTITFNTVSSVVGGITLNTTTGIITVKEAGVYIVMSSIRWNAQTTGTYRQSTIQKNGGTELSNKYSSNAFLGGDTTNPSWVGSLAVNDTLSSWVNADGSSLQLNGGSPTSTFIMVQRLF